jgi:hypothetical protein
MYNNLKKVCYHLNFVSYLVIWSYSGGGGVMKHFKGGLKLEKFGNIGVNHKPCSSLVREATFHTHTRGTDVLIFTCFYS